MSILKHYLSDKGVCRVKFMLPHEVANSSNKVYVVGEFNNWDQEKTPMRNGKNGNHSVTGELPVGKEYQFRYLIDDTRWENEKDADKQVPSPYYDSQSSVIVI